MAIDPVGTAQPVKLATMPLAAARQAARQAVRLTSEQNQQLREARLAADEKARELRAASRADAEAKSIETAAGPPDGDSGGPSPAAADIVASLENRGERLDIFA